jgi:ribonuclease inhibitor
MDVFLDGATIRSQEELHDALKRTLELPEYYGRNLDALWDCLTGWIETPLTLVWQNYEASRRSVGDYADRVLGLLRKAEKEVNGFKVEVR